MKQVEFEQRYRTQWETFSGLLQQLEGKRSQSASLSQEQASHFTQQYRRVCQLLGMAKQRSYSAVLIAELNQIVMRGHQQLYRRNNHYVASIIHFITTEFPQLIRQERRYVWLAAMLLYFPTLILGVLTYHNDLLVYSVFNPEQVNQFAEMYDPEARKVGRERDAGTDVHMFGYYIMNNVGIGFRTFASGLLFGLGSIFFLIYNGVVFGAVAGYLTKLGFSETFYPFVCGHGSFELTAIVFAGAAGLKLGWSLVSPGPYSRLTSLKRAARRCVKIVYGVAGMLVIAAFIEAFWSSSSLVTNSVKYGVAAVLWAGVIGYFVLVGRRERGVS